VKAVIDGLRERGHETRTVAIQSGTTVWSDDVRRWRPATCRLDRAPWFRLPERAIRRVQSELSLPFLCFFDSARFADACVQVLGDRQVLYERHGYLGYGGLMAARRLGIPHVLELNGNILSEIDEMRVPMSGIQRRIGRAVTLRTLHRTDHVVVVSSALKRLLVDDLGVPADRVSVVLNGVDIELFSQPFDRAAAAWRIGVEGGPVVLFTGSFQPWHGVELLVAAFDRVRHELPRARLVLVGDGAGRASVEQQVSALGLEGHVRFLGHLPQAVVAEVLSAADVVAAPYPFPHDRIVGTPLKIMEYMAAGKAIVASTAPLHEIVEHGVTGLRVAPADPGALARGILEVLRSDRLRADLGSTARARAQSYSWGHVVGRICDIFDGLLSGAGPQSRPTAAGAR
jgi:glycosyltransferase involved in cell wall biosynthesis